MRISVACLFAALCSLSVSAQADEDNGKWHILLSNWDYDPSGTVTDGGTATSGDVTYDVDSDLNMSSGDSGYFRIAWEKAGTSRSNAAFFMYDVESVGGCEANNATRECDDGSGAGGGGGILPPIIGGGGTTDITARAEASAPTVAWWSRFGDDTLSFDLGLSLSYVDGTIVVRTETDPVSNDEFNSVIPALYAGFNLNLKQNIRLHISANGVSSGGDSLLAMEYGASWMPLSNGRFGFGLEVGHRSFDVQIDDTDNGDSVDIELDGTYLGALLSF